MIHIDFNILIIINAGISLIMGFYMILLHKNSPGVKGTFYWSIGSIIIGVGLLLRLTGAPNDLFVLVVPPLFVTVGLYSYLAGIWHFKLKKINTSIIIGIPTIDILQSAIFSFILPSHKIRMEIHLVILIIYCLFAFYEMVQFKSIRKSVKNIFILNAISFFVYLLILLLSFVSILISPNFNPSYINQVGIILYVISGFIMIALTFGFLSAVNLQLYSDLDSQLKSKTKFFAIIAHDLKGPLGTIMNFLNYLNNNSKITNEKKNEFLEKIEMLSKSTYHLLHNLLDWATTSTNIAQFENEKIDVNELIFSNISFLKTLTDIKSIDLEISSVQEAFINGNTKMIEAVVRNLVSNAIKFTPKGGKITILTKKKLNHIQIVISDTGTGIPQEKIKNLFSFEKSTTTKGTDGEPGSGLGLVLCNDFIHKNNGTLQINSQLNIGTHITIEFPLLSPAPST
ncbi:MAG: HAMP domain-containing histidine kinase [Bacteroidales bacterium]|nr:HAMP domain-containing histidine kinase [Bacteroidales bacterium]